MNFVPEIVQPKGQTGPAWWFLFNAGKLLVKIKDNKAALPFLNDIAELSLTVLRRQYLGTLDGQPCYSAELNDDDDAAAPEGMSFQGLRSLFGLLEEEFLGLSFRAVQIMAWDQTHQFCGRCGTPTQTRPEERAKVCPECSLENFPRISPAIMAAVIRDNRILLARGNRFPPGFHSVLAGFLEPGETLEECVQREVREEVGITVKNLRYFGSQPWPFPNSFMIAFITDYAGGSIKTDGTEIVEAGWYTADNLPNTPPKFSIAGRLIGWYLENYKS